MNNTPTPRPGSGLSQARINWQRERKAEMDRAAREQAAREARPWVIQTGTSPKSSYSTVALTTTHEGIARLRFATVKSKARLVNPDGKVVLVKKAREV